MSVKDGRLLTALVLALAGIQGATAAHRTAHQRLAVSTEASETSWDYSSILSAARDDGVQYSGTRL